MNETQAFADNRAQVSPDQEAWIKDRLHALCRMAILSCGHNLHALASFRFAVSLTEAEDFCFTCGNWILRCFRRAGLSPVSERYYR